MSEIEKERLKQLEQDVQDHDEVHAYIAELGEERDFRSKDIEFNHDACLVTIDDGVTFYRIQMEHIIYWTPPRDF